ncbi:hypothetical protein HK102_013346 [Quaeritorhiza haematococci]|nr:hypothetical protein HK102_013346 [Quaeritorhiza haematococci]
MVFKKQLADKYGVPLEGKGWIYHKERRGIRMACNALKNYRDKMPQARTQELEKRVGEYYHRIDMKYDQDEGTYTGPSQEEEGEDIQAASNGVIERKTEASMDELVERGLNEVDLEQGSDFIEHGEAVVSSMTSDAQIEDFVKMWRRHFLQHLQPKHLSAEWDVDAPVFRT